MSMRPEIKKYLFDVLESAKDIIEYTNGLEYPDFVKSGMVQAAVERKFQIIGEALNHNLSMASSAISICCEGESSEVELMPRPLLH